MDVLRNGAGEQVGLADAVTLTYEEPLEPLLLVPERPERRPAWDGGPRLARAGCLRRRSGRADPPVGVRRVSDAWDFSGRTVIVTGAAQGIGRGVAERFAAAQATVVMVDVDADRLDAAASEVGGVGIAADVGDSEQVEAVVADALRRTGGIDVLFNNAGGG